MFDMFTHQHLAWIRYESRPEQAKKEHVSGDISLNWTDRLAAWVGGLMIAAGEYLTCRFQDECAPASAH